MKRKILSVMVVAAVAALASYNVYMSKNDVKLSNLALNNVEALANSNEGGDSNCHRETTTWQCTYWASGSLCYCGL